MVSFTRVGSMTMSSIRLAHGAARLRPAIHMQAPVTVSQSGFARAHPGAVSVFTARFGTSEYECRDKNGSGAIATAVPPTTAARFAVMSQVRVICAAWQAKC